MTRPVLLVNTNVARPPVSPVGLEYVGETLVDAGVSVQILDLSFEADWKAALQRQLKGEAPLVVGLTVRNTDDCSFVSRKSFLPWIHDVVTELRKLTDALVFLGGGGFSIMPELALKATQADGGIHGDGEETMLALARCLIKGEDFTHLPNLAYRHNGAVILNHRLDVDLNYLPLPRRRTFDNRRYEQLGAQVGMETKRGCQQGCIYCADPVAKGKRVRFRPLQVVVQELLDLADQGVTWLHLCDSEFNIPIEQAKDVCQAIIAAGLADKLRWYCYCSPVPFDRELAGLMRSAGCAGINFGVDSLCDEQLHRMGRQYSSNDVAHLVRLLRKEGLNYIFDLLAGGPGETEETLRETINKVRELEVPLAGIAGGLRVYPGTPLARAIADGTIGKGLHPDMEQALDEPVFYLSPHLGDSPFALMKKLINDDPRFLTLSAPNDKGSYNYADDEALFERIKKGARGAYWDIIRQSYK